MQLSPQKTQLLIDQITNLLALEELIGSELSLMSDRVMEHAATTDALRKFGTIVRVHGTALRSRLEKIGGDLANIPRSPSLPRQDLESQKSGESEPASSSLQNIYSLFSGAILGYAILHVTAHRFYDSIGDGNTADMAEKHLRDYAELSQSINHMLSDAVVWDLGRIGQECQCQCPSCSLGVCLCSPHGTNTVDEIWRQTVQTSGQPPGRGILVRPPRIDSAALSAGLRPGDSVIAINGQEVRESSLGDVQAAIRKHNPGETILLRVQRQSGKNRRGLHYTPLNVVCGSPSNGPR